MKARYGSREQKLVELAKAEASHRAIMVTGHKGSETREWPSISSFLRSVGLSINNHSNVRWRIRKGMPTKGWTLKIKNHGQD